MTHFDRFDICEAHNIFTAEWHKGGGSREYRARSVLVRLGFRMAPGAWKESLTENGRDILASLIRRARRGEETHRDR